MGWGWGAAHGTVYSLEHWRAIGVGKERHGIGHHPNVAPAAVKVRQAPVAVLIIDSDHRVVLLAAVHRLVVPPLHRACNHTTVSSSVTRALAACLQWVTTGTV